MTRTDAPVFRPGLDLSRALYEQGVAPLLRDEFPHLHHAAARVGGGSEVLGFDTARSADHEWGPRLQIFLAPDDLARHGEQLDRALAERLPKEVLGWPTHFQRSADPNDPVGHMGATDGPIDHRVELLSLDAWLSDRLGLLPAADAEPGVLDWLAMPQQYLAETTGGAVFHDDDGALTAVRQRLAWYPDQVWRYLIACQWQRVAQEEAFPGRCAEVGDELGAAVVAARQVRELMRLCFLLARRYAPYSKWLGSAFALLPAAPALTPALRGALAATDHAAREAHLCEAYEAVARLQNATGLAEPQDPTRRPYHGRPFLVLHADRFARAVAATVTDPALRALPLTGAVDQWADSTDLLPHPAVPRAALRALSGS